MTVGLITRDANNVITTNMTYALSQSAGYVVTNKGDGSLSINLPADKKYFYIVTALEDSIRTNGVKPGVTITQNLLSWDYKVPSGFPMNCRIDYGYY